MSKNERIKAGYWAISTQKHLKQYRPDSLGIGQIGNLNTAGKVGRLLGMVRGNGVINNISKLNQMAFSVGITSTQELQRFILPIIEEASDKQVELIKDTTGQITGIAEYLYTNSNVLEVTGASLEKLSPESQELITIETMDETKKIPFLKDELIELITQKGFDEGKIDYTFNLLKQFNMIQIYDKNPQKSPVISNEYVWGKNSEKISHAISNLEIDNRNNLKSVIDSIQGYQGFPLETLLTTEYNDILLFAKKIGIIHPTVIASTREIKKEFGFTADLFNSLDYNDDILDDVKLLLASIRFGEKYTPYSTIQDPIKFLQKLINNGYIGPHSANNTDYILLEKKGIVRVVEKTVSNYFNTRTGPCLELVKKDVAEEALKILRSPDYVLTDHNDITDFSSLTNGGEFITPEESRILLGNSPENIKEIEEHALRVLRGEIL